MASLQPWPFNKKPPPPILAQRLEQPLKSMIICACYLRASEKPIVRNRVN